MNYSVSTSMQLRPVLRAMRRHRRLTQEQAGALLGVSQKRLAAIEKSPGVTGFDQISRLVTALGGRLVVEMAATQAPDATARPSKPKAVKSTSARKAAPPPENW